NAVSSHAWTRREGHEAEGLCRRGLDDLPYIDMKFLANDGNFIHQADVDSSECILKQLGHLCNPCRRDRHDLLNRSSIKGVRQFCTGWRNAANDFGRVARVEVGVARIDAFRRKGQEEVNSYFHAGRL